MLSCRRRHLQVLSCPRHLLERRCRLRPQVLSCPRRLPERRCRRHRQSPRNYATGSAGEPIIGWSNEIGVTARFFFGGVGYAVAVGA